MANNSNNPEVRFAGYNEDWVKDKIINIAPLQRGFDLPKKEIKKGDYPVVMSNGVNEYHNEYKVKGPGVVTGRSGTIGNIHYVKSDFWPHNTSLWVTDFKGNYPLFIYRLFKKLKLSRFGTGSGVPTLNRNDVHLEEVFIPRYNEQKSIAVYFQNLDQLITQHQQKLTKLQTLKKAMLDKMFPKEGATVPEIRFKGFSSDWEENKLDDIGKSTSGTSIESEFNNTGKYKVISIGSYSEQSTYTDQGIRTNLTDKTEKRILNKNDLTMVLNDKTASGNILGRVLLINEDDSYVYNQRTQRIEPYLEKYNSQFLYQLLNASSMRMKILKLSQGNTQIYVNWSTIKDVIYMTPNLDEQRKIGDYFKNLDVIIKNHNEQLTKLQNLKKACLAKMFV